MAKKITLFSFSPKNKAEKKEPEEEFIRFLKKSAKKSDYKNKKILILSPGSILEAQHSKKAGLDVTALDEDLPTVKKGKADKINYVYSNFFNFARRTAKNSFDYIADIGYSNMLLSQKRGKYFRELSKMLTFNGVLFTIAASTKDGYSRLHCPQRLWTKVDDNYVNYYSKDELQALIEGVGFSVEIYIVVNRDESKRKHSYHVFYSSQRIKKW